MTAIEETVDAVPAISGTLSGDEQSWKERVALTFLIGVPFAALIAAVPVLWGWGLTWTDLIIAFVMYGISGHGVTVGFHRLFTHSSFKAKQALRVGLAVAGSLAIQGPVIRWVADHRRHHRFSDRDGDPHSPWRYGETLPALLKGMWHAHIGWLFDLEQTDQQQYAPDLLKDRAIVRVSRAFPYLALVSLLVPAARRRPGHLELAGRADRVLLGQPGPRQPPAPHDLVHQLHLPRGRRAAVPVPRPVRQRLVAGRAVDGRVLAQPAPQRPDRRAPRRAARADRQLGPDHLGVREVRLGQGRALAQRRAHRDEEDAAGRGVSAPAVHGAWRGRARSVRPCPSRVRAGGVAAPAAEGPGPPPGAGRLAGPTPNLRECPRDFP